MIPTPQGIIYSSFLPISLCRSLCYCSWSKRLFFINVYFFTIKIVYRCIGNGKIIEKQCQLLTISRPRINSSHWYILTWLHAPFWGPWLQGCFFSCFNLILRVENRGIFNWLLMAAWYSTVRLNQRSFSQVQVPPVPLPWESAVAGWR